MDNETKQQSEQYARESAEYQVEEKDGRTTLVGYPVIWGALSGVRNDGYRHRFARNSVIFQTPATAVYAHDASELIGNTSNNSLRITPDDKGVRVEIDLPDTTTGRDVATLVRDGYTRGMSIGGFINSSKRYEATKERELTLFVAHEVTITGTPAMVETSVELQAKVETKPAETPVKQFSRNEQELREERSKLDKYKLAQLAGPAEYREAKKGKGM